MKYGWRAIVSLCEWMLSMVHVGDAKGWEFESIAKDLYLQVLLALWLAESHR